MKLLNIYKSSPPDFIIHDAAALWIHAITNVEPPYSTEEIEKIEKFSYLYFKFLKDNGMTTRKLVESQADLEHLQMRVKDLTDEGRFFNRNFERFLDLSDFNVDPNKRVERILVKGLKEMRAAHERGGEINYTDFQDYGYIGLYGGLRQKDIKSKKGLAEKESILDHMNSEELAANLFRATQTDAKIKRENITGQYNASVAHREVGEKVRNTIKSLGGTMPENLPVVENIKNSKKRIKETKKIQKKLK